MRTWLHVGVGRNVSPHGMLLTGTDDFLAYGLHMGQRHLWLLHSCHIICRLNTAHVTECIQPKAAATVTQDVGEICCLTSFEICFHIAPNCELLVLNITTHHRAQHRT